MRADMEVCVAAPLAQEAAVFICFLIAKPQSGDAMIEVFREWPNELIHMIYLKASRDATHIKW